MTATRMKAVCRIDRAADYIYRQPTSNHLNYVDRFCCWDTVSTQICEQILLVTSAHGGICAQMSDFDQYGGCMLKSKACR